MTRPRLLLTTGFIAALLSWWALARVIQPNGVPIPNIEVSISEAWNVPELAYYRRFEEAKANNEIEVLQSFAVTDDYLAYQAALELANNLKLDASLRYQYLQRAAEIEPKDPLNRQGQREQELELGFLAEQAGLLDAAKNHFQEALPEAAAVEELKRLELDPYALANRFFQEGLYAETLLALDGRLAPSLEALSYKRTAEPEKALDAYARWLLEEPQNTEALLGKAWSHYSLAEYDEAEAIFAQFSDKQALYGRALIRNKAGDLDSAVVLLSQTDDADYFWLATDLLEAKDRYAEALPFYLKLAKGSTSLADDAAYRAFTLATELNDFALANEALSLLKQDSFFALKLGGELALPSGSSQDAVKLNEVVLAERLAAAGQQEAAIGELKHALKKSTTVETTLQLAEALQQFGEYRQSQRAVSLLFFGQSQEQVNQDLRAWRLAYPRAYANYVLTESNKYGIEPELIWAIMRQESGFFVEAISRSNAQGLMQVIPSTWDWLAELQQETPANPFDVATNIRYGVYYINWLAGYFEDYLADPELMIASYNRGQGYIRRLFESDFVNQDKDLLYREIDSLETREYLQIVTKNYLIYKALYGNL